MEKTLGELRIRTDFNPSNDKLVDVLKQDYARLLDKVNALPTRDGEAARAKAESLTLLETSAMWAVKCATF